MQEDMLTMDIYNDNINNKKEDNEKIQLKNKMEELSNMIKTGKTNMINMENKETYNIIKNIKDNINTQGNLYQGKSWYGENDYENFIIVDKEGQEWYMGEKL
jgi:hypothetical protein